MTNDVFFEVDIHISCAPWSDIEAKDDKKISSWISGILLSFWGALCMWKQVDCICLLSC